MRFELTGPCGPPVFKTGAIDHSATLPCRRWTAILGPGALCGLANGGLIIHYYSDENALKLDLEAGGEAAFMAFAKDPRPLVQIKGEDPITVADLTVEISQKFFHGIVEPIKEKRVNKEKAEAFERLLGVRLLASER